jgi:nitrogen regulatory protein P-II 2
MSGSLKGRKVAPKSCGFAKRSRVHTLPKLKIKVAAAAAQVDEVIQAITTSAKTGQIGDGKIFVFGIDQAVRIRTGEVDAAAL